MGIGTDSVLQEVISALGIDSGRITGNPSVIRFREGLPVIRSASPDIS